MISAALALVFTSCAKTVDSDEKAEQRDYFMAWMAQNHPGVSPNENGIYILEETEGRGSQYENQPFAYMDITIADIEGNISSTTNLKMNQQLGTYVVSNYYGPTMAAGGDNLSAGLYYALSGMKRGGTRKVIVPFWLSTYNRYDNVDDYYRKSSKNASNAMYTIKLADFTSDIDKWEIDSLQRYLLDRYHEDPDSVSYGRYYYQLSAPTSEAKFDRDATIYINYTGRLLNGQDTAIVHNIYSASKTYAPQSVKWSANAEGISMGGSSSLIKGFYETLWDMRPHEKGVSYFISELGYSYSGSGNAIPAYSPLCFEIEIVDKP